MLPAQICCFASAFWTSASFHFRVQDAHIWCILKPRYARICIYAAALSQEIQSYSKSNSLSYSKNNSLIQTTFFNFTCKLLFKKCVSRILLSLLELLKISTAQEPQPCTLAAECSLHNIQLITLRQDRRRHRSQNRTQSVPLDQRQAIPGINGKGRQSDAQPFGNNSPPVKRVEARGELSGSPSKHQIQQGEDPTRR